MSLSQLQKPTYAQLRFLVNLMIGALDARPGRLAVAKDCAHARWVFIDTFEHCTILPAGYAAVERAWPDLMLFIRSAQRQERELHAARAALEARP